MAFLPFALSNGKSTSDTSIDKRQTQSKHHKVDVGGMVKNSLDCDAADLLNDLEEMLEAGLSPFKGGRFQGFAPVLRVAAIYGSIALNILQLFN